MRSDVKSELQMLRELVWFFLLFPRTNQVKTSNDPLICHFCHDPLVLQRVLTFGHRRHPKVDVDISLHHIDLDRDNNDPSNIAPCHTSCHKSYHNKLRAAVRNEIMERSLETHAETN